MSAGRNENVVPGNFCGRIGAQRLDVAGGRTVVLLQADQRVAVLGADRAGVLIGHVDAGERQADIVDDVVELIGRNGRAHRLLDLFEQTGGFLDARAGLARAHASGSGRNRPAGKKFSPRNGTRPNDSTTQARKPAMKVFGRSSASDQQRAVAARGHASKRCSKPCWNRLNGLRERIGGRSRPMSVSIAVVMAAHQVVGHRRHERARQDERADQRENHGFRQRPEQIAGDAAKLEHRHEHDAQAKQRDEGRDRRSAARRRGSPARSALPCSR